MREMLAEHKDLSKRLDELEQKYDKRFTIVFDAVRQLMAPPPAVKKKFGFDTGKNVSRKQTEGRRKT